MAEGWQVPGARAVEPHTYPRVGRGETQMGTHWGAACAPRAGLVAYNSWRGRTSRRVRSAPEAAARGWPAGAPGWGS